MSISELEFFNSLSGRLAIELTEPAEPMAGLTNLQASSHAKIVKATLNAEVYLEDEGTFRSLSPEELESIAYPEKEIALRAESGDVVKHTAPNGEYFTVEQLLKAVELTEQETRNNSEWFGGVDVHHCFFEGIEQEEDGVWEIYWGS